MEDAAVIPRGAAVFEMRSDFLEEACGTSRLSLDHGETSNRKLGLLAERMLKLAADEDGCKVVLDVLWVALARTVATIFGNLRPRPGDGWLNPSALQRSVEHVEANLGGELPVSTMGDVAGLSPSAFLRAFRGSTGVTPGEFIIHRRIVLGARLIATTDLPVAAIARRAGFKSGNHFATAFAARQGVSPLAFRQARRRPGPHQEGRRGPPA